LHDSHHLGASTPGAGAIHPICFWRIVLKTPVRDRLIG